MSLTVPKRGLWRPSRPNIIRPRDLLLTPAGPRARNYAGGVGSGQVSGKAGSKPGIVFLGRKSGSQLGATSNPGIQFDLTTLTSGDLGANPTLLENDFVIVTYALAEVTGGTADLSMNTSGYAQRVEGTANDTNQSRIGTFYKFMGASPDSSADTVCSGDLTKPIAGLASVWRFVDLSTPFDVADAGNSQTNTILCDPPSITPTTKGGVGIWLGGGAHTAGTQTFTDAGDFDLFVSAGLDDTFDVTYGWGYKRWSGSGAMNPGAWTFSAADNAAYSTRSFGHVLRPMYPG